MLSAGLIALFATLSFTSINALLPTLPSDAEPILSSNNYQGSGDGNLFSVPQVNISYQLHQLYFKLKPILLFVFYATWDRAFMSNEIIYNE